jgi:hypothetical protein
LGVCVWPEDEQATAVNGASIWYGEWLIVSAMCKGAAVLEWLIVSGMCKVAAVLEFLILSGMCKVAAVLEWLIVS